MLKQRAVARDQDPYEFPPIIEVWKKQRGKKRCRGLVETNCDKEGRLIGQEKLKSPVNAIPISIIWVHNSHPPKTTQINHCPMTSLLLSLSFFLYFPSFIHVLNSKCEKKIPLVS